MISRRGIAACAVLLLAACSSNEPNGVGYVAPSDASTPGVDSGPDATDAGTDVSAPGCVGACKTTSLVVDIGGTKRPLDRAQFGTQQGDAGAQLHVEAHAGGSPECPSQTSPTPTYTLIVSSIPRGAAGGSASKSDGVASAFFDFKGDLGLPPLTKATAVSITSLVEDSANPPAWSAFDVTATFPEGTVTGHIYAEYCASLSE
jgi:hypothetical protein